MALQNQYELSPTVPRAIARGATGLVEGYFSAFDMHCTFLLFLQSQSPHLATKGSYGQSPSSEQLHSVQNEVPPELVVSMVVE